MRHPVAAILLGLLALASARATPPPPFLVADLNHLPVESDGLPLPSADSTSGGQQPVAMAGVLYFAASDPAHGQELWRSDPSLGSSFEQVIERFRTNFIPGADANDIKIESSGEGRLYWSVKQTYYSTDQKSLKMGNASLNILRDYFKLTPGKDGEKIVFSCGARRRPPIPPKKAQGRTQGRTRSALSRGKPVPTPLSQARSKLL